MAANVHHGSTSDDNTQKKRFSRRGQKWSCGVCCSLLLLFQKRGVPYAVTMVSNLSMAGHRTSLKIAYGNQGTARQHPNNPIIGHSKRVPHLAQNW
eukprot:5109685-Amphidinium_carterae.1